jgi:hypothetical protein
MPAVEEEDYDVMYSIDGVHLAFKRRTASNLWPSLLFSGCTYTRTVFKAANLCGGGGVPGRGETWVGRPIDEAFDFLRRPA